MTKYIILLLVLIGAGGVFLFAQMNVAEAPTEQTQPTQENLFGEGSSVVGPLEDNPDSKENENEDEDDGDDNPSGGTQSGTTGGTTGVVTRAQLASHNKQADCWIGYKGTVYDITSWLPRHPGSAAAIAPYCGKAEEFAQAFNKMHGTSKDSRLQKEGTVKGTLGN